MAVDNCALGLALQENAGGTSDGWKIARAAGLRGARGRVMESPLDIKMILDILYLDLYAGRTLPFSRKLGGVWRTRRSDKVYRS